MHVFKLIASNYKIRFLLTLTQGDVLVFTDVQINSPSCFEGGKKIPIYVMEL